MRSIAPRHIGPLAILLLISTLLACAGTHAPSSFAPGPTGTPQRGGHAIFVREEDPDYLDPALSYGVYSAPMIAAVFRNLLDYTHEPGPAGAALIPDLAETLPDVREDGTLYAFKVRKDARFGAPLHRHITAADFKYAIERLYRVNSPGASFYKHIAGVDDMLAGKDTAIAGLIARGDSLYVRLSRRDPIFANLFTMSFTAPMAREVVERWPDAISQHTVASGPYQIAEYVPRRHVVMVRNPDYCGTPAWLDTFEIKLSVTPINAVAMIRRGLADGAFCEVPAAEYGRIRRDSTWARQLDIADGISTWYLFMDIRQKPFDDVRVRQAVCWAIDRRAIVKAWSGKATPAGEFLPPSMPGARRLGRYLGPDIPRARRLLAEAGYPNGFSSRFYAFAAEPNPREAAIVQQNLADVGIRVTLDISEAAGYTAFAGDTSNHVAFGFYGWYADYVDPSNFFDTLLNGHRIIPLHNNNLGCYSDPRTDAMIERAMVTADDSVRTHLYQQIDERIMDAAAVAPTVHTLDSRLYSARVGGWYRHITRIFKIEDLYLKAPGGTVASRTKDAG